MANRYVILDHHLDEDNEHYRIEVGLVEDVQVLVFEEDGHTPVTLPGNPVLGDDGEPVLDDDGEPVLEPGEVMTEQGTQVVATEDFLFAADDKKWDGLSLEEIAAKQGRAVLRVLRKREKEAAETAGRKIIPMATVGKELKEL
jgi:hypothetical protein